MAWDIIFEPYLSSWVLWSALILAISLTAASLFLRQRGMIWRGLTLAFLILTLANPSILEEERDPINDVVAIVTDQSISQSIGNREAVTQAGLEGLRNKLSAVEAVDLREINAGLIDTQEGDGGTRLFTALKDNLIDVPPERLAGAVIVHRHSFDPAGRARAERCPRRAVPARDVVGRHASGLIEVAPRIQGRARPVIEHRHGIHTGEGSATVHAHSHGSPR